MLLKRTAGEFSFTIYRGCGANGQIYGRAVRVCQNLPLFIVGKELTKLGKGALKGLTHYLHRGSDSCPYLKCENTLVEEHPHTVEGSAALF